MVAEPLIGKIPADSTDKEALVKQIKSNSLASGVVVSPDLTTASITATIGNGEGESLTLGRIDSVINANKEPAKVMTGRPSIYKKVYNEGCSKRCDDHCSICSSDYAPGFKTDPWRMEACFYAFWCGCSVDSHQYGFNSSAGLEIINYHSASSNNSCCCGK